MTGADLVSLVMPSYNHARYVGEAVRSAIGQSYENVELLILDDGSTDGSFETLEALGAVCEKRFARFVLERRTNQGTATALNRLFRRARGVYLASFASDDLLHKDYLRTACDFLSVNRNYGAVSHESCLIDENSRPIGWDRLRRAVPLGQAEYGTFGDFLRRRRPEIDFLSDDFGRYENLLLGNYIQGMIFRREYLAGLSFTSEAPLEDWFMALQLAKQTKIKFIPQPLYFYRWHGRNSIRKTRLMYDYGRRTMAYEAALVMSSGDEETKAKFRSVFPCDLKIKKWPFAEGFHHFDENGRHKVIVRLFSRLDIRIPEWSIRLTNSAVAILSAFRRGLKNVR